MSKSAAIAYRERLRVPLRWWAQSTMLMATVWLALVIPLHENPWVAHVTTLVLLALTALLLRSYGDARLTVTDGTFQAGRAQIAVHHLGEVEALDAEDTRRVAGRDADARAFLLLRPYLKRAVRVEIRDAADPTPYWLVSSRHCEALAEALRGARDNAL